MLYGMPLRLKVEDIYFIIGLSYQGKVVKLSAGGLGGGVTIEEYITVYCLLDIENIESEVLVNVDVIVNSECIHLYFLSIVT